MIERPVWDGREGTAGGAGFGTALEAVARERETPVEALAEAAGLTAEQFAGVVAGSRRVGISEKYSLSARNDRIAKNPIATLRRNEIAIAKTNTSTHHDRTRAASSA